MIPRSDLAPSRSRDTGEFSFYSAPEGVVWYSTRARLGPARAGREGPSNEPAGFTQPDV